MPDILDPIAEGIRRAQELREQSGKPAMFPKEPEPEPVHPEDLIPQIELTRSPEQEEIESKLDGISIVSAYRRWCNKSEVIVGSKTEGIMISCPNPNHPDKNPSAWINTEKDVWNCPLCGGGDKFDIAAYHFGFSVPGYKSKEDFPRLRRRMVEDYYGVIITTVNGKDKVAQPYKEPDPEPEEKSATITPIRPEVVEQAADAVPKFIVKKIDWKTLLPDDDTFLDRWMPEVTKDDAPDTFFLFLGLAALGLAVGRDVTAKDRIPVKGNLFICLYGDSSTGKSRSVQYLARLLDEAIPFDQNDPRNTGAKIFPLPGSPEALLASFVKNDLATSSTGAPIFEPIPVRGLLTIDELASIVSRSHRQGSDFRPTLQSLFDAYDEAPISHVTRTKDPIVIKNPLCCCVASTQTAAARDLLTKYDAISGFLNRWIFVLGEPKESDPFSVADVNLESAIEALKNVHQWAATNPGQKDFSDEGKEMYRQWFWSFRQQVQESREQEALPMNYRLDLIVKKLSLLFSINRRAYSIGGEDVQSAIKLVPLVQSGYELLSVNIEDDVWTEVQEWLMRRLNLFAEKRPGEWLVYSRLFNGLPKKWNLKVVNDVLRTLMSMGWIEFDEQVTKNQRKVKVYRVRPL